MKFSKFETLDSLDEAASEWIIDQLDPQHRTLICAATGNSPTNTYRKLVKKKERIDTSRLSFIKLDEWYGLEMTDPGSCEHYLQQHLLRPLNISADKIVSSSCSTITSVFPISLSLLRVSMSLALSL